MINGNRSNVLTQGVRGLALNQRKCAIKITAWTREEKKKETNDVFVSRKIDREKSWKEMTIKQTRKSICKMINWSTHDDKMQSMFTTMEWNEAKKKEF